MNYSRQAAGPKKHTRLPITYSALPGLLVLLVLASIAMGMSITVAVPAMMAAIVLGYAARYVAPEAMMNPGVLAGTGVILRLGVALLGLRISFSEIAALGLTGALAIPVIMGVTILTVTWLGAKFLKDWQFGLIAGASIAICGASAAMAMSAILPQTQRNQHSTLLIVVGVTTLSTIAMIVYPSLAVFMGLSSASSGLFLGGSIHDVAQVVGAGYAISDTAGDASVVVKLYRVTLLAPILIVSQMIVSRSAAVQSHKKLPLPPWFVGVFLLLCTLNTLGWVPNILAEWGGHVSTYLLVTAVAALGFRTSLKSLVSVGVVPVSILTGGTILVLAMSLLLAVA